MGVGFEPESAPDSCPTLRSGPTLRGDEVPPNTETSPAPLDECNRRRAAPSACASGADDGAARVRAGDQSTNTPERNQPRDALRVGREAVRGLLSRTLRHAGD